mmetsp:Transcript_31647/g.83205  ORF Transcript_31647/g.83205 Transcript_31647/m.83205 type:complete len:96 (-) Transcript_31647:237-524(-)
MLWATQFRDFQCGLSQHGPVVPDGRTTLSARSQPSDPKVAGAHLRTSHSDLDALQDTSIINVLELFKRHRATDAEEDETNRIAGGISIATRMMFS